MIARLDGAEVLCGARSTRATGGRRGSISVMSMTTGSASPRELSSVDGARDSSVQTAGQQ
jgi:hypothetical protein